MCNLGGNLFLLVLGVVGNSAATGTAVDIADVVIATAVIVGHGHGGLVGDSCLGHANGALVDNNWAVHGEWMDGWMNGWMGE